RRHRRHGRSPREGPHQQVAPRGGRLAASEPAAPGPPASNQQEATSMTVHMIKPPHGDTPAPTTHHERRRARYRTAARAALHDERVRTVGRLAVRHGAYITGGARIVARRAWDGRTASRYERMIRAAEAAGLMDEVKEWEQRAQAYRAARHKRRLELLQAMVHAPKAIAYGTVGGTGILLLIGIMLAWG